MYYSCVNTIVTSFLCVKACKTTDKRGVWVEEPVSRTASDADNLAATAVTYGNCSLGQATKSAHSTTLQQ